MSIIKTRREQRNRAIADYYIKSCVTKKSSEVIEEIEKMFKLSQPQIYAILRSAEL